MKRSLPLTLLVALGAPGCYFDLTGDEPEPGPRSFDAGPSDTGPTADSGWGDAGLEFDAPLWEEPRANSLDITSLSMSGALGTVSTAPGGEFYVYESFGGENYMSLDLRSRTGGGVIMNLLAFENTNLMEVGQTYRVSEYSAASLHVEAVGCSGPSDGNWYADTYSSEVTVDVREGPEEGSVEIFYSVLFANSDTVDGSFVMPTN